MVAPGVRVPEVIDCGRGDGRQVIIEFIWFLRRRLRHRFPARGGMLNCHPLLLEQPAWSLVSNDQP